jgi:hypothetical protein
MLHIILTSETLLMNQRPLRYTVAAVSTTTAAFTAATAASSVSAFSMSTSGQPVRDMDLLSKGTAPVTADKAMTVIEERMIVRSRGNPKEQIPG